MSPTVAGIIARISAWADAQDLTVEPMGGLTNTHHLVTVNEERFELRLSSRNGALLGIDRAWEREALMAASAAGIGPNLIAWPMPRGPLPEWERFQASTRILHWGGECLGSRW